MTWFKIDDRLHAHPKALDVLDDRPTALALWLMAGSWCAAQLTDGRVPARQVTRLGFATEDAEALVRHRLWHRLKDGGYTFHDWSDFQPAASDITAARRAARQRMREKRGVCSDEQQANSSNEHDRNRSSEQHANGFDPVRGSSGPIPVPSRPVPSRPDPVPEILPFAPSEPSQHGLAAVARGVRKAPRPRRDTPDPVARETWDSYSAAFQARHGVEPVRNARVNSQISQLVKRLGAEAPAVAAHYVGSNNARYVAAMHSVGCLLQDAEKLRTEWATGRRGTSHQAREADKRQGRGQEYGDLIRKLEAEEAAQ